MPALLEKALITMSLLGAFPLFFLDKELMGVRRFAWLGAFSTGLTVHLFLDPTEELAVVLDKFTVALVCITIIPHIIQLLCDNLWLGCMSGPPLFVCIHLMVQTTVDSEEYWKLRAFLHMAVFSLPYLNHLPTSEVKPEVTVVVQEDSTTESKENEEITTTTSTKAPKSKTKKHKK